MLENVFLVLDAALLGFLWRRSENLKSSDPCRERLTNVDVQPFVSCSRRYTKLTEGFLLVQAVVEVGITRGGNLWE